MKRKVISAIVVLCMTISLSAYGVMADTATYAGVSSARNVAGITNYQGGTRTLSAKAVLTSGSGGAWVQIRNSYGTSIYTQKLFPFQDPTISPVTNSVANRDGRTIYVLPGVNGQSISGSVVYGLS